MSDASQRSLASYVYPPDLQNRLDCIWSQSWNENMRGNRSIMPSSGEVEWRQKQGHMSNSYSHTHPLLERVMQEALLPHTLSCSGTTCVCLALLYLAPVFWLCFPLYKAAAWLNILLLYPTQTGIKLSFIHSCNS